MLGGNLASIAVGGIVAVIVSLVVCYPSQFLEGCRKY